MHCQAVLCTCTLLSDAVHIDIASGAAHASGAVCMHIASDAVNMHFARGAVHAHRYRFSMPIASDGHGHCYSDAVCMSLGVAVLHA